MMNRAIATPDGFMRSNPPYCAPPTPTALLKLKRAHVFKQSLKRTAALHQSSRVSMSDANVNVAIDFCGGVNGEPADVALVVGSH